MTLPLLKRCLIAIIVIVITPAVGLCIGTSRHALVIGNDSYPGNSLVNARNDARAVAKELGRLGYSTTLALDLDRQAMIRSVDSYARSLQMGDTAVVYYAGHGLQVEGQNYLVPTDFHVAQKSQAEYRGYPLHSLLDTLSLHGATTEIVILDACRDNPFLGTRSLSSGWASVGTSAGIYLAFGTSPGSTAADNPAEGHGLFTQALLEYLDDMSEIDQMFRSVRADVISRSKGAQIPWISSSLVGSFHMNPLGDDGAPLLADIMMSPEDKQVAATSSSLSRSVARQESSEVSDETANSAIAINHAVAEIRGLHFDKALDILKTVVSLDPRCARALQLLGAVYQLIGKIHDATRALDAAIDIDPGDALSYSYKCLLEASERSSSSEATCRKAISMKDRIPQTHLGLAISLARMGRDTEAYLEATKAVTLDPTSAASVKLQDYLAPLPRRAHLEKVEP